MKILYSILTSFLLLYTVNVNSQVNNQYPEQAASQAATAKIEYLKSQSYLSKSSLSSNNLLYGDSLKAFDERAVKAELLGLGISPSELNNHLVYLKRKHISNKYFSLPSPHLNLPSSASAKPIGGNNFINVAPCVNEGFEQTAQGVYSASNAVAGWTLSSRNADGTCHPTNWTPGSPAFTVHNTPISNIPLIGALPHSPLGGTKVVQLNNFHAGDYSCSRLTQSFPVTAANSVFQFAFAGIWQDAGASHYCCAQPWFEINVRDCSGTLLTCPTLSLTVNSSGCQTANNFYSTSGGTSWTSWQVRSIDLTPFIGTCVNIEVFCADCAYGGHYGALFFDSKCGNQFSTAPAIPIGNSLGGAINFCAGSTYASIQAPLGYANYSWTPPIGHPPLSVSQATQAAITTSNAVVGNSFSVLLTTYSGCTLSAIYTLSNTTVGITAIETTGSCLNGSIGSATVLANGSGAGYNYSWINSTSSVVATSSIAANLSPGNYSVTVSAIGSSGCGVSSATAVVAVAASPIQVVQKYYCGNTAYLSAPLTGTNYQWYNGTSSISSNLGGTLTSYTHTPVTYNTYLSVAYLSTSGCRDSLNFVLAPEMAGTITQYITQVACGNLNNGLATISFTTSPAAQGNVSLLQINSIGTTPSYSVSINTSSVSGVYTATNLAGNGSYSVSVFDGTCKYSSTFSVASFPTFNSTLNPIVSPTVCNGNTLLAGISMPNTSSPGEYNFSWTPTTFLLANTGTSQQTLITPTTQLGNVSTIVYSIVITPTIANCPQTQTLAVTVANLSSPTITSVPPLCTYSPLYTFTAIPSSGIFSNNTALNPSGILTPSLASIGLNTFTYAISVGTCVAQTSGTFYIGVPPTLTISGNTSICEGQSTTLLAGGATTYTWNNSLNTPLLTVSPNTSTSYSVTGLDATTTCTTTTYITVTVMTLPAITIFGNTVICLGETTTLNASGGGSYIWNTTATTPSIIISPTTTTQYTVQGTNAQNSCFDAKSIFVIVNECVGIKENALSLEEDFIIYPNPAKEKLFIETKQNITISIHDALGKLILKENLEAGIQTIDLKNYSDGIYVVSILQNSKLKTLKLIKKD